MSSIKSWPLHLCLWESPVWRQIPKMKLRPHRAGLSLLPRALCLGGQALDTLLCSLLAAFSTRAPHRVGAASLAPSLLMLRPPWLSAVPASMASVARNNQLTQAVQMAVTLL